MLVEHDAGGRYVKVRCLPVSIPFNRFVAMARDAQPIRIPNVGPDTKGTGEKLCCTVIMTWNCKYCVASFRKLETSFIITFIVVLNSYPTPVILSVDSVDYTKGLNYRLNAFEHFLEKYPTHRGKVVFVLVVQPAGGREHQQLKETLDNMVHQINMRFLTSTWTPIHYIQRPVFEEELAGFCCSVLVMFT